MRIWCTELQKQWIQNLKMKHVFLIILAFLLVSCGSDDDVCTSGEATPRIKIKFKSSDGKEKTLDFLYLSVDYASGKKLVIKQKAVDSVSIPLRVDEQLFTDIYVKETEKGPESKIRVNYQTKSQYVSPACGIKKLYETVDPVLLQPNPVTKVQKNQNEIINENKTHLFLIF